MNRKVKRLISLVLTVITACSALSVYSVSAEKPEVPITENNFAISTTSDSSGNTNLLAFTGEAMTPDVVLYDNSKQLVNGVDYDLSYENNINVGEATITVTFKGNYTGTRTVNFNIVARELSNNDVIFSTIENQTYTGGPLEPKPNITIGDVTLVEGTDYDLNYTDNINAGIATVNVTFKGNYSGTASTYFEITAKELTKDDVLITDIPKQEYTGNPLEPKSEIKYGDKTLVEGVDYDITYENNTDVGTGTATITFKNNYDGEIPINFTIDAKPVTQDDVIFSIIEEKTYSGSVITPEPIITVDNAVLVKDKDYTLSYENNINVGTATVVVTFTGNYSGSASTSFTIVPMVVTESNITISTIPDQTYTGGDITPEPVITDISAGTN